MSQHTPSVLAFSRQNVSDLCASLADRQLPQLAGSSIEKAAKGGYVLEDVENREFCQYGLG